jgi:MFS family permease
MYGMNWEYGLAFGAVFFSVMIVVGIVRARRTNERAYYISGLVSGLMLLATVSILLSQFVLFAVFFIAAFIVSVVGMSNVKKAFLREAVTQRQETNVSEPLNARDLLTWKGWFKLASRWGVRKAMYVYVLIMTGISGAMLFIASILGIINPVFAAVTTIIVAVASVIIFRRQIEENLHITR